VFLKLFPSLLDQSSDAIEVIDPKTLRLLDCNKSAYQTLGYSREEFLSLNVRDIDPTIDPSRLSQINEEIERSGFALFESLHRRKDGSTFPVEVNLKVIRSERDYRLAVVRDITERKRAEEALRQAEEKYHSIFENAVEGIFQTSPDGQFITANPALARMLGYDSPDELLGSRTDIARQHYVEPARRSDFKRLLELRGVVWEFEHQAYRKDGSKIWLSENVRVVRDESGAVLYYEGFTEDITERKRVEQRLREYEKAVEGLDEMIIVIDRDYRYLLANYAFLAYRGLEREQLVGRLVSEALNPGVFENVVKEKLNQCFEGHVVKYEMKYNYPELGERDLFISYFPIEGPAGVDRVACVLKDITESKRAEEALRESQRRLEEAQRIAHVGHWERDLETGLITWSNEIYRILGLTPQEHDSPLTEWQHILHPEDRERVSLIIEEAQRGIRRYDVEYRIVRPDGEVRFLHSQGDIILDEQGRPRRAFGIAQDITERKRAEEQLKQSEQQLAEAQHIARVGSWNWDLQNNALNWSAELYRIYGVDPQAFNPAYEGVVMEFIHAEDQALVRGAVENSLKTQEPFSFYYRILRPDGKERVIHSRGDINGDEHGNPIRMFGTAQDVTELKQAEERLRVTTEQLRALSARIHSAKEEEGTRIAREIHDELGAALTSLRWDLESFNKVISESGDQSQIQLLRERIDAMLRLTEATISSVRRISAELRPGILDDLGLAEAIEWQAQQFQARTGIICRCDCSVENLDLSREQSIAVFRILQEALTNILRHAQATSTDITMKAGNGEFVLTIMDNGRGITEDEKSGARSLGLLGMRERAHLIGGKIDVTGVEGEGTVITVQVPISD
jgi:PAS domain S-box-containing protein